MHLHVRTSNGLQRPVEGLRPRGSGPVGRMAPGGPAEHAGAQTPHELQLGARARLPGGQGAGEAVSKNGFFGLKTGWQKGDM